jgi:hypothetical protein
MNMTYPNGKQQKMGVMNKNLPDYGCGDFC